MATGSRVMSTERKLSSRWQMKNPELKFTKKVTDDEKGTRLRMSRIVAEKPREVERRRFYVLSMDIEAYRHVGRCLGCALLTSQEEAAKSCGNEFRERIGTTVEIILAGEARREKHARTESLRESESEK